MKIHLKLLLVVLFLSQVACDKGDQAFFPPIRESSDTVNSLYLIVGEGEIIYLNSDNVAKKLNFTEIVRKIYFLNENEGWILDKTGQIWATNSKGENWVKRADLGFDANGVSGNFIFLNSQVGWLNFGFAVLLTEDGGNSWRDVIRNTKFSYTNLGSQPMTVFPVDENNVWLGMTNSRVLRSDNKGKNWSLENIQGKDDVNSIYAANDKECWIAGTFDGMFYTNDGGNQWNQILDKKIVSNLAVSSIEFSTPKIGWAVGFTVQRDADNTNKLNGILLKSADGGKTWNKQDDELYKNRFCKIKFANPQTGWLMGEKVVYKTTDGGINWQKIYEYDANANS